MYSHWYLLAFLVVKSVVVVGDVSLSCATMTPQLSSNLTCTCTSTGSKIKWQVNGTEIAECFQSGSFCSPPQPSGFTLLVGSSTYNMTIDSFTYDSCVQYTCLDSDNQMLQDSVAPELQIDFNTVPKETKVPASNHSNGEISVSTECFTDHLRIKKQWYIIRNGADSELYTPGESISINNEVFCNECNGDSAYSLKIGINHEEATGDKVEVQFRLVVFHDDNPSQTIDVTFKNFYYVTETKEKCLSCLKQILITYGVALFVSIQLSLNVCYQIPRDVVKEKRAFHIDFLFFVAWIPFFGHAVHIYLLCYKNEEHVCSTVVSVIAGSFQIFFTLACPVFRNPLMGILFAVLSCVCCWIAFVAFWFHEVKVCPGSTEDTTAHTQGKNEYHS